MFMDKGASEEKIKKLAVTEWIDQGQENNKVVADDVDRDGCAICLAPFEQGDKVTRLACSHTFCQECIGLWLAKRNLCPMCKAEAC